MAVPLGEDRAVPTPVLSGLSSLIPARVGRIRQDALLPSRCRPTTLRNCFSAGAAEHMPETKATGATNTRWTQVSAEHDCTKKLQCMSVQQPTQRLTDKAVSSKMKGCISAEQKAQQIWPTHSIFFLSHEEAHNSYDLQMDSELQRIKKCPCVSPAQMGRHHKVHKEASGSSAHSPQPSASPESDTSSPGKGQGRRKP